MIAQLRLSTSSSGDIGKETDTGALSETDKEVKREIIKWSHAHR